ncbi:Hypothetical predicted protein [Paramuricea clavata]|uniref:Uncharacterized protein n=1 Tax=Paramuricea clavata TaxID=317549 RepID=A0A7D9E0L6_PARCT|nr:Hypothetical predicted protein [Paramuricea clavata]
MDEMLELCEAFCKATRLRNVDNYFELSNSKDWNGNAIRLVLCDDPEFGGQKLARLRAVSDDMEVDGGNADSDPDPLDDIETLNSNECVVSWNECFEKFYF